MWNDPAGLIPSGEAVPTGEDLQYRHAKTIIQGGRLFGANSGYFGMAPQFNDGKEWWYAATGVDAHDGAWSMALYCQDLGGSAHYVFSIGPGGVDQPMVSIYNTRDYGLDAWYYRSYSGATLVDNISVVSVYAPPATMLLSMDASRKVLKFHSRNLPYSNGNDYAFYKEFAVANPPTFASGDRFVLGRSPNNTQSGEGAYGGFGFWKRELNPAEIEYLFKWDMRR
jgi:hypothetical protein